VERRQHLADVCGPLLVPLRTNEVNKAIRLIASPAACTAAHTAAAVLAGDSAPAQLASWPPLARLPLEHGAEADLVLLDLLLQA